MISVWQFSFPCTLLLLVTLNGVQTTPTTLKDLKSHYTDLSYWNGLKADFWVSSPVSTSDLTAKHHELQSERSEFEAQLDRQTTSSRDVVLSLLDYQQQKKEYDVLDRSSAAALNLRNIWDGETNEAEKLLQELAEGVNTYPALDTLPDEKKKQIGYDSHVGEAEFRNFIRLAGQPADPNDAGYGYPGGAVPLHPIRETFLHLRDRAKVVIDAFTEHKSSLTYAGTNKELKDIEAPYMDDYVDKIGVVQYIDDIKKMFQDFYDDYCTKDRRSDCQHLEHDCEGRSRYCRLDTKNCDLDQKGCTAARDNCKDGTWNCEAARIECGYRDETCENARNTCKDSTGICEYSASNCKTGTFTCKDNKENVVIKNALEKAISAMDRKIGQIEEGNQKLFKLTIRSVLKTWLHNSKTTSNYKLEWMGIPL